MKEKIVIWSVDVSLNGERVLSIGDDWLSGRDDIADYKDEVVRCAEHLLSFIGGETEQVESLRAQLETAQLEIANLRDDARYWKDLHNRTYAAYVAELKAVADATRAREEAERECDRLNAMVILDCREPGVCPVESDLTQARAERKVMAEAVMIEHDRPKSNPCDCPACQIARRVMEE